ncbi:hypothetical protein ACRAWF_28765 [Streptomyces sp. L7]
MNLRLLALAGVAGVRGRAAAGRGVRGTRTRRGSRGRAVPWSTPPSPPAVTRKEPSAVPSPAPAPTALPADARPGAGHRRPLRTRTLHAQTASRRRPVSADAGRGHLGRAPTTGTRPATTWTRC